MPKILAVSPILAPPKRDDLISELTKRLYNQIIDDAIKDGKRISFTHYDIYTSRPLNVALNSNSEVNVSCILTEKTKLPEDEAFVQEFNEFLTQESTNNQQSQKNESVRLENTQPSPLKTNFQDTSENKHNKFNYGNIDKENQTSGRLGNDIQENTSFANNRRNQYTYEMSNNIYDASTSPQLHDFNEILSCEIVEDTPVLDNNMFDNIYWRANRVINNIQSIPTKPNLYLSNTAEVANINDITSLKLDQNKIISSNPDVNLENMIPPNVFSNHNNQSVYGNDNSSEKQTIKILQDIHLSKQCAFSKEQRADHTNFTCSDNIHTLSSNNFWVKTVPSVQGLNQTEITNLKNINDKLYAVDFFNNLNTSYKPVCDQNNCLNTSKTADSSAGSDSYKVTINKNISLHSENACSNICHSNELFDATSGIQENTNAISKDLDASKKELTNLNKSNCDEYQSDWCFSDDFLTGKDIDDNKFKDNEVLDERKFKTEDKFKAKKSKTKNFVMEVCRKPGKIKNTKQLKLTDILSKKERVKCDTIAKKNKENLKILKQSKINFTTINNNVKN